MDIRDYTEAQMQFLDACKIKKLPDTNNVMVSFFDLNGWPTPSVMIGRKQLVLLLEKIARDFSKFPAIHAQAATLAMTTRDRLWPKSL